MNRQDTSSNSTLPSSPNHEKDGLTRPSRHQQSEPRLPHERDESSDSQQPNHDERAKQAARDIDKGLVDTGRAPVVEKLASEHFPPKEKPA